MSKKEKKNVKKQEDKTLADDKNKNKSGADTSCTSDKKPSKGNKPGKGNVNRDVKKSGKDMTKQTGNDPSFYGNNASLVENMTNIYFNHPTGYPIPGANPTTGDMKRADALMGGVLCIPLIPTYGDTQSYDSPLGMAGKMIYMSMSSKTGRKSEYQMSDVLQYMMAVDNIYMHLAEAQRVYGLFRMVSPFNRYLPKAIIESLRWDYDDVASNPANFRYQINRVIDMVNQIVMPQFNDLFKVHMSLINAVYYDHEALSAKPQYITFTLGGGGYRYFDELGLLTYGLASKVYKRFKNSNTGRVTHAQFCDYGRGDMLASGADQHWTVSAWLSYMLDCVSDIMGSETFTRISTDLMLRFNTSGFVQLNPIPEDYVTPFVYDQNVMMMLQNATYTGTDFLASGLISESILTDFKSDTVTEAYSGVYSNYLSHDGVDVQAIKSRVGIEAPCVVYYTPLDNGGKALSFAGLLHNSADTATKGIKMFGNTAQQNYVLNLDFDYQPNGLNLLEATRLMYGIGSYNILHDNEIPDKWIPTSGKGYHYRPWYIDFIDYGFWVMLKPKLFIYDNRGSLTTKDWALDKYAFQFYKGPRLFTTTANVAGKVNNQDCDIVAEADSTGNSIMCKSEISEAVEYQIVTTIDRELLKKLTYIAVSSVLRVPVNAVPDLQK